MTARVLLKARLLRSVAVALLVLSFAAPAQAAIDRREWKNQQSFEITAAGLVKIGLPASTLSAAAPQLTDLRLVDADGNEVPCVIEVPEPSGAVQSRPKSFRVQLEKLATRITIETGATQPIERIRLLTSAHGFIKAARVEISNDAQAWEIVGDGFPLSQQTGSDSPSLPMSRLRAAYVRITIDDWRAPAIPFTAALLDLAQGDPAPSVPVTTRVVKREEFAEQTVLSLELEGRRLPLASVAIDTDEPFFARVITVTQRELREDASVETTLSSGSIFRTRLSGNPSREHLELPLNALTTSREVQMHVLNQNDAPLRLQEISIRRRPVWLIFNVTRPGKFELLTGHPRAEAPRYDLSRLRSEWIGLRETSITISAVTPNPGYQHTDSLANLPLAGARIDLSKWEFRKPIEVRTAGVYEVELDLDVLARSSPGFSDLRIVQDGSQIPYLLESTSMRRSLPLELKSLRDARAPQVGRWQLSLPRRDLPIDRLTLTTSSPLFSRSLRVYEWITDTRGEKVQRLLSNNVTWDRTPDRSDAQIALSLSSRPLTDTLYLETDNGDNSPITIVGAKADHLVTRIVFRSDGRPADLLYGSASATSPHYDLRLIAVQLLTEERTAASLGPESRDDGNSPTTSPFTGRRASVLLWVSLGVAVAALLFAIARLLPKTPGSGSP